MLRKVMRKPAVLDALGIKHSTLYEGNEKGIYPKGTKLNPDGRVVIWFEDQIEAVQKAAVERQAQDAEKEAVKHRVAQDAEKRAIERNSADA
jgi:predicted DNA-binding transcriptional regulator AlpA